MTNVGYLVSELHDLRGAVEAQTEGLAQMLKIIAVQNAMLKEILVTFVCQEPDGLPPLIELILKLNEAIEGQTAAIKRIEAVVAFRPGADVQVADGHRGEPL